jgi:hypothetical protein
MCCLRTNTAKRAIKSAIGRVELQMLDADFVWIFCLFLLLLAQEKREMEISKVGFPNLNSNRSKHVLVVLVPRTRDKQTRTQP